MRKSVDTKFAIDASLILLTFLILVFPARLSYEHYSLQSVYAFSNPLVFGIIYYTWLIVIFVTIFKTGRRVLPVMLFSLVFLGYWNLKAPGGQADELNFCRYTDFVTETGTISEDYDVFPSFAWPSTFILYSTLQQVTGTPFTVMFNLVRVILPLILALTAYSLGSKLIRNKLLLTISTILVIVGNGTLATNSQCSFSPLFLGVILFVVTLLSIEHLFERRETIIVNLLLMIATTLTHIYAATATASVVLASNIVHILIQKTPKAQRRRYMPATLFAILIFYNIFLRGFFSIFSYEFKQALLTFSNRLLQGQMLKSFSILSEAHGGASRPIWISLSWWTWSVLIYILGSILALEGIRSKTNSKLWNGGGILGVALTSLLATSLTEFGGAFGLYLLLAPFIVVPVLVLKLSQSRRKVLLGLLVCLIYILSLPSFFTYYEVVGTKTYAPHDYACSSYLKQYTAQHEKIVIYTGKQLEFLYHFHLKNAIIKTEREPVHNTTVLMSSMFKLLADFKDIEIFRFLASYKNVEESFLIFSDRIPASFSYMLGTSDQDWIKFNDALLEMNRIYDNCYVQIYL